MGIAHFFTPLALRASKLKTLLLGMNQVSDDTGEHLFQTLLQNECLQTIDLSATQIGPKTIKSLANLISVNSTMINSQNTNQYHDMKKSALREIILSCNTFNGKGAKGVDVAGRGLYEAVTLNKGVTLLDLRGTDISEEFLESIQSICKE